MISSFDSVLDHLLKTRVRFLRYPNPPSVDDGQVRFQPPDNAWRSHVSTLNRKALNVYLADLRENRKLRTNERTRSFQNGLVNEEPAPARVDCHYLITAESPATEDQGKTIEEHRLLQEVTAVLMNTQSLVPRQVFFPAPLPAGFPALIADAELPFSVLPSEGFPKLAEFWGTMGTGHRWKPAVYIVITLPVALESVIAGPMVTTRITEYRQMDKPETAEVWIQIGGHVLDSSKTPPRPIDNAWVRLETTTGEALQTIETNEEGQFTFGDLRAGRYQLRTRAAGFGEKVRPNVDVPSSTGEYDLQFP